MSENVLTLAPGNQALNQSLGFGAASVIVDNLTSSYAKFPDLGKSVPPWVYGAVLNVPRGINRARAQLLTTVPAVAGPPVPAELAVCTMTWTDLALPPSAGHLLQQAQYGQQTIIGTLSAGAGVSVGPTNFAVPTGTQSIGLLAHVNGSNNAPHLLSITGHDTGMPYVDLIGVDVGAGNSSISNGGPQWQPFGAGDHTVDCSMTAAAGNPAVVDILASPQVLAIDVFQAFNQNLDTIGQPGGTPPLVGSVATTGGVYKQILAPVGAGVSLILYWARFDVDVATGGVFALSTDGVTADIFAINDNGKGPYVLGPFGAGPEDYGHNKAIKVFTTNNSTVRYHIDFTTL